VKVKKALPQELVDDAEELGSVAVMALPGPRDAERMPD
jgi:hypothetical protein